MQGRYMISIAVQKANPGMVAITRSGKFMRSREQGFTYLGLLFVVAVMGLTMTLAAQVWESARRREQEAELLFVGNQFRQAISQYYMASPDSEKHFPMQLEDLLKDNRSAATRRFLRKIYRDPLTNSTQWGLVMAEEGGHPGSV